MVQWILLKRNPLFDDYKEDLMFLSVQHGRAMRNQKKTNN